MSGGSPLAGIFGTGRCGSTWVGAIIDSHPDTAYRFEPLHRGRDCPAVWEIVQRIDQSAAFPEDLDKLYEQLRIATAATVKPPFFPKSISRSAGRDFLWPLARKSKTFDALFKRLYSAHGRPLVVFKEVSLEKLMRPILKLAPVPMIYVLRHPCGVVASHLRGHAAGLMPTGRAAVLADLMHRHDPALAERHKTELEGWSPLQRAAMLWRLDSEKGVQAVALAPANVRLIVYERLCRSPESESRGLLDFLGLDWHRQCQDFIAASTQADAGLHRAGSGILVNKYFSVFRNPLQSMSAWKNQLDPAQIRDVMTLVEPSSAFAAGAAAGAWN
jgi:hypothetical protein